MADGKITLTLDYGNIPSDFKNLEKMIDESSQKIKGSFDKMSGALASVPETIKTITFQPVLESMNGFLDTVNKTPANMRKSFADAKEQVGNLSKNLTDCKGKLLGFFEKCKGSGVIDTLGKTLFGVGGQFIIIAAVIAAVVAALMYLYQNSEEFRTLVDQSLGTIMDLLNKLYTTVLQPLFALLKDLFDTILMPLISILADVFVTVIGVIFSVLMMLWNEVLAPIANFLVDVFGMAIQALIEIWESWKPMVDQIMSVLGDLWENILKPIALWIQDTLGVVFKELGKVVEDVIKFVKGLFQGILDFFIGIFTGDLDKAWQGICKVFGMAFQFICDIFSPIIDWFKDVFNNVWEGIKGAFIGVKDFFMAVWNAICSCFNNVVNWFRGIFAGAWQAVKDVFSAGGKVFEGIKDGILSTLKSVINALISGINTVIKIPFDGINAALKAIKNVDIFGFRPFSWIGTISVPQIPKLAQGGIVNRPTLAMIGEAGKEVVMPLQNNTAWMNDLADIINARSTSSSEDKVINLYVDGEKLFQWILKRQKKYDFVTNGGFL